MKTISFILTALLLSLCSCFPEGDLLPDSEPFKKELSVEAKTKCVQENPSLSVEECDISRCLASPLTLIAMQELLIETSEVLNGIGIKWFIEAGTVIGSGRFNAHLPWDDDVDLGVFEPDFTDAVIASIEEKLKLRGFSFKPLFGNAMMRSITGYQGLYQVAYTEGRFKRLILSESPTMSSVDVNNLWLRYSNASSMLPHLDIFTYKEAKPGEYTYTSTHFSTKQLKNRLIPESAIVPLKEVTILGKQFPTVNNFQQYCKSLYNSDDIINNFYVERNHSAGCKTMKFADIRKHPEIANYLIDFLDYTYKRPAAKALGMQFDKEAVRKRYLGE